MFKNLSSEQTRDFYERLTKGEHARGLWGMEQRFDAEQITQKPSVLRHFMPAIARYLDTNATCLDLGCGPGGFLVLMAPYCKQITGADIVPGFVNECRKTIARHHIDNATVVDLAPGELPFASASFDRVVMVDTIHHLERPEETLLELARVLKPGGLFLIFEPNKHNPILALLCALDKNEHGLLRLGTFSAYRKLLVKDFDIVCQEYSGLLVGPESRVALAVADFVSRQGNRLFGWFSPKLFMVARKRQS
jgi:ubiquinone/menaquinone biosynthesis C-methylase UbiE